MKLSLELIVKKITRGQIRVAARGRSDQEPMRLTELRLYCGEGPWDASAAYVLPGKWGEEKPACPSGITLIVLGDPDPAVFEDLDADVLIWVPEDGMDFSRQFNELEEIFQDYRRMELRIQERLIAGAPPEELAALCEQYLGNPIILMDNSFSLLLRPRRTNPLDWEPGRYPQQTPSLSAEMVSQIRMSREFRTRWERQGLFYLSSDTLDCGALFLQVQEEGATLYLAVLEMDQPITAPDRQLLLFFSQYLCRSLVIHRFSRAETLFFLQFLTRLLRNEKIELPEFNRQLQSQQWKIDHHYVCFVTEPDLWDPKNSQAFSLSRMIERRFPGCCAFTYEERIVCILNLTQVGMEREVFLNSLSQFIRDQVLRVGVSYGFRDFVSLPNYYHQALAALDLGKELSPDEWSYRFEKYVMSYFLRYGTSRMEGKYLCHPDLMTLRDYDRENHTQLLKTLYCYLACGLNATAAAEALYIHRNTLYQRLGKIEALITSNLNNPETRLYLQISYQIGDFS